MGICKFIYSLHACFFWSPSRISMYSFIRFWDKELFSSRRLTMSICFPNVRSLTILSLLWSRMNTVWCETDEWLLFRMFKLHYIHLLRAWHFEWLFWKCRVIFQITLEFIPCLFSFTLGKIYIFSTRSGLFKIK